MHSRRSSLLPLALAALLLAGCSGGTGENTQAGGAETPEAGDGQALLVALEDVAPGLGDDGSLDVAEQVCTALNDGKDSDEIDQLAFDQFGDVATGDFTLEQAQEAVRVIATEYCE